MPGINDEMHNFMVNSSRRIERALRAQMPDKAITDNMRDVLLRTMSFVNSIDFREIYRQDGTIDEEKEKELEEEFEMFVARPDTFESWYIQKISDKTSGRVV